MRLIEAALRYTAAGLAAIPIWRDDRKNPHLSTFLEFNDRLPTRSEWIRWAALWPGANIGLITGYWGLVALDFDDEDSYYAWSTGDGWGVAGHTWTVRTGRGYHVWFRVEDPGASRNYVHPRGRVLLRAKGGYCIVPPSVHHSGKRYRAVHKIPPLAIDDIEHYLKDWKIKEKKTLATRAGAGAGAGSIRAGAGAVRIEDLIKIPDGARPNGRGAIQVHCPFHDDQKASAWLNIEQQRFGCNACWPGLYWDTVNVYARLKSISNGDAYKIINTEKGAT